MQQQVRTISRVQIGELAAELGLNPKTIRYYEEIGLLSASSRTPAGYRLYEQAGLQCLRFILKAKAVGFKLDEISQIIGLRDRESQPCQHVLALVNRRIADIDHQRRALNELQQELHRLRQEAADTINTDAFICGIIEHHESAS